MKNVFFQIDWPSDRRFQVVGFGLNAVDWIYVVARYPEPASKVRIQQMHRLGGGQVATACALCARYGLQVRYLGRVGDDEAGRLSLEDLRKEPMDLSYVDMVPGAFSQYAIIILDRSTGERTIFWDRDPKLNYQSAELKRDWIVQGQLLHLDGHDQSASVEAARWAKEAGLKTLLDIDQFQPGVEELLGLIDFAIPNLNFVKEFSGCENWREGLLAVSEVCPGFVAVTRGKEGVGALWEGEIFEIPGIRLKTVDTTGAGDVFHGAFAYALFQNWSLDHCLRFANAAGALSCTRHGARGGIPTLQEVLTLVDID